MGKHTADLSDGFFTSMEVTASKLGARTIDLLMVCYAESGCRANVFNHAGSGAIGLIQFMPQTLINLGWHAGGDAFSKLTAEQQVLFLAAYMKPHAGKLGTLAPVYCAVFMPAFVSQAADPDFILVDRDGGPSKRSWAYSQNMALDENGDGKIMIRELERAVARNCRGPRWREIVERATGVTVEDPPLGGLYDLGTILGLQTALKALGFDSGPLDGLPGTRTSLAIRGFQANAGLIVDGVVGPATRGAILRRLQKVPS